MIILYTLIVLLRCVVLLCDNNEDYADSLEKISGSEVPFRPTQANIDSMLESELMNGDRVLSYSTKDSYRVYTEDFNNNKDYPQFNENKPQSQPVGQAIESKLAPQPTEQDTALQSKPLKANGEDSNKFTVQPSKNLIKSKYFPLQQTMQQAIEINPASQFIQPGGNAFKIVKPIEEKLPQPIKIADKNKFHTCPPGGENKCQPNPEQQNFGDISPPVQQPIPINNEQNTGNNPNERNEDLSQADLSGQNVENIIPEPDQPINEHCQFCPQNTKQNIKTKFQPQTEDEDDGVDKPGCQNKIKCPFHTPNNLQNVPNGNSPYVHIVENTPQPQQMQQNFKNMQNFEKLHSQPVEQNINSKPLIQFEQFQSMQQNLKNIDHSHEINDKQDFDKFRFQPVEQNINKPTSQLDQTIEDKPQPQPMQQNFKNIDYSHQTNSKQEFDKLHSQLPEQNIDNKPPTEFEKITEDKSQFQPVQENLKNIDNSHQTNYKQNNDNKFHSQPQEQNFGDESLAQFEQIHEEQPQSQHNNKNTNYPHQINNKQDLNEKFLSQSDDQDIEERPPIEIPEKSVKHYFQSQSDEEKNRNIIQAYPAGQDFGDGIESELTENKFHRQSEQKRIKNKYRVQPTERGDDIEDDDVSQSTKRSQSVENDAEELVQNEASKGYIEMESPTRSTEKHIKSKFLSQLLGRKFQEEVRNITHSNQFSSTARSAQCVTDPEFDFSYADDPTGPYNWSTMFRECDGSKQSPINIDTSELQTMRAGPLRWSSGYFSVPRRMTLENTGHELVLRACFPSGCVPRLSGGPLHKTYRFKSINFHWGMNDLKGSEHTIDEMAYPMEMHVVHTCGSEDVGKNIVIVAYFFQIANAEPDTIESILEVFLKAIKNPKRLIKLRHPFNLAMLVQPFFSEYITYSGSLTIPPCTQGVKWIVYPYPLDISREQLEKFRSICKYAPRLKNNFRPIQSTNHRRVCFVA